VYVDVFLVGIKETTKVNTALTQALKDICYFMRLWSYQGRQLATTNPISKSGEGEFKNYFNRKRKHK
jgi:hypothetical protein